MNLNNIQGPITVVDTEDFPKKGLPEVVFVGRSNVGKSSLINSLFNRKNLAYTSSKPGKTQTINFFEVDEKINVVDVPGYGYAQVSKKKRSLFATMIERYMQERLELIHVFMLIDFRHEPTQDDHLMVQFCDAMELPFTILATKADKISKNKWATHIKQIKQAFELDDHEMIIPYSAVTHDGKDLLIERLDALYQAAMEM